MRLLMRIVVQLGGIVAIHMGILIALDIRSFVLLRLQLSTAPVINLEVVSLSKAFCLGLQELFMDLLALLKAIIALHCVTGARADALRAPGRLLLSK